MALRWKGKKAKAPEGPPKPAAATPPLAAAKEALTTRLMPLTHAAPAPVPAATSAHGSRSSGPPYCSRGFERWANHGFCRP